MFSLSKQKINFVQGAVFKILLKYISTSSVATGAAVTGAAVAVAGFGLSFESFAWSLNSQLKTIIKDNFTDAF